jgi:hypothetical protein
MPTKTNEVAATFRLRRAIIRLAGERSNWRRATEQLDLHDNGKPVERPGRKVTGLNGSPANRMIAGLPGEPHVKSGLIPRQS